MLDHPAQLFYVDVDTGIDDALALSLLARSGSKIAGIGTVSGNVSATTAAANTLNLLALLDAGDVPVALGAAHPMAMRYAGALAHVHGENGIGNVYLPEAARAVERVDAADLLISLAKEHAGLLEVIAVGPLTNLAMALQRDPNITSSVRRVTLMGGAVAVPGNVSAMAEANFYADPEAANIVLRAAWEITIVPLDVTLQHTFGTEDQAALLAAGNPGVKAVAQMLSYYLDFHELRYGERRCAFHDALAAAVAIGAVSPKSTTLTSHAVNTSAGATRGSLVASVERPRHRVVSAVNGDPREVLLSILGVPQHAASGGRIVRTLNRHSFSPT